MTTPSLLENLPASVELAAGSGKTWTLADTARTIAAGDGRTLILTHTIAGVHAMRAKLHEFEIDPATYHVTTLTSFAIELASAYVQHSGFEVPDEVDLSRSNEYIQGASTALAREHVRDVFRISFTHVLVDEYQDCSKAQHQLVVALKEAIPAVAVFGDRLQGIFGFADPIVDWEADVQAEFPNFPMPQRPRRWEGHNEDLGAWLLTLRPQLTAGNVFDMSTGLPDGVTFMPKTQQGWELINAARENRPQGETVVVVAAPNLNAPRAIASRLPGYAAMEEMGGSFMAKRLAELVALEPSGYALWLAGLAKDCFTGYGKLDKPVLARLSQGVQGKPVAALARPGFEKTLAALDRVRVAPALDTMARAMHEIREFREARLHSREAWHDLTAVVECCGVDPKLEMLKELSRVRERVRHGGRGRQFRVVSRTVLIKGLEYDHVIIANIADVADASNLYVALSRARKSVTIIGPSHHVTIKETKRA